LGKGQQHDGESAIGHWRLAIRPMKQVWNVVFLTLIVATAQADEQTRAVQERLKDEGFFYGTVNGQSGSETSAALRRYQIRYGLRVTGELDEATRRSLGLASASTSPAAPQAQATPGRDRGGEPSRAEPRNRGENPEDKGDPYYDRGGRTSPPQERDLDLQPRSEPQDPEFNQPRWNSPDYRREDLSRDIFGGTPYEAAPEEVRQNVTFAAQGELARLGFYRGSLDGQAGPATIQAILRFQRVQGLVATGQFDEETLGELHLLPGQENGPSGRGFIQVPGRERVYRGIWLH
jgi:peptidoglycan hydrolase-like protein with peptidoglycan-binding domain